MTIDQANAIKAAYQQCCLDESLSGDALGTHWLVMDAVELAGIKVRSTAEAMKIAAKVFEMTDEEVLKWKNR